MGTLQLDSPVEGEKRTPRKKAGEGEQSSKPSPRQFLRTARWWRWTVNRDRLAQRRHRISAYRCRIRHASLEMVVSIVNSGRNLSLTHLRGEGRKDRKQQPPARASGAPSSSPGRYPGYSHMMAELRNLSITLCCPWFVAYATSPRRGRAKNEGKRQFLAKMLMRMKFF